MADASSYFDLAGDIYWSALYGNDEGDLEDLDAKLAEELQFQEAILLSAKETISSPTSTDTRASSSMRKQKPRKSAKKPGECDICVDRKERHQMFTISGCSHSFCVDCISTYVKTRLEQHITIIKCPGEGCGVMLELEACRPRLPKEAIHRWEDLLCEELLCATGGRIYCPFKDCSVLLLNDNQGEIIAETECPNCHRLFCAQCKVPWHPGISCEEYQKLGEGERGRDDLMVRNLAKEKKWRNCPSCRFMVERTEGCPHMTCWCKYQFCYACRAEWTHDHGGCQGD
ncbi:hypothetical protein like AT3G14250 [Hibiscus trionum]|uniref:RBR-type E3 ubiquitin transferase n=1 Tax=Hibiscus trionum TaxID=183268 RepID=A0A9W7IC55_HIBTR|nr:hypothetical protein like AT3G14250 [Hibiscus trionum]